jgi:hypothetical protein
MKFIFGFLVLIVSVVVTIILVISLFGSSGTGNNTTNVVSSYDLQESAAVDSVIIVTVTGPTVADENFRSIRYTFSKNTRTVESLKGYKGALDKSQVLTNSPESYKALLGALSTAQFSKKKDSTAQLDTACATGNKYVFELTSGGKQQVSSWTSTCNQRIGTFAGDLSAVNQLVKAQFPNLSDIPAAYSF